MFPEISRFIEEDDFYDQNSPGKYYAEAMSLHKKYKMKSNEALGQDTVKAYYKVNMQKKRTVVMIV